MSWERRLSATHELALNTIRNSMRIYNSNPKNKYSVISKLLLAEYYIGMAVNGEPYTDRKLHDESMLREQIDVVLRTVLR